MLQFKSRRAFSLIAITIATTAATPAIRRSPGITFDVESTTASQNPMAGGSMNMKMIAKGIANLKGSMRMDLISADAPPGAPAGAMPYGTGDYFLTLEGKTYIVRPATKTYVDMTEMATSAIANLPPALLAQMTISDITTKSETLADGAPIDGRQTQHIRTTVGYSMNMMGQALPTTVVSDYWLAKLPVTFTNPLAGAPRNPLTTGPMVELVAKQIEIAPKFTDAMPLKVVMATTVNAMGQTVTTTVTSEMKNIKEGDVDESKFVLPEGYTKAAK